MNGDPSATGHDPFTVPPGKRIGCLPRISTPGSWCPLAEEHIEAIPREQWPELFGKLRNRDIELLVNDQNGVGSCATESSSKAVEFARIVSGQEYIALNPWSVYHFTSHGSDRGSSIDENLRHIREHGVCPEYLWPRSKGWRTKPSNAAMEAANHYRIEEFYDVQTIDGFVSCLLSGFPVVFGYRIGGGGHSVLAMDAIDASRFLMLNSWGSDWGDSGFGKLLYSQIYWGFGAWALRVPTFSDTI